MPQFILNTPPSRADAQRAVAYGYLKPAKRRAVHPFNDLDELAHFQWAPAKGFLSPPLSDHRRADQIETL